MDPVGYLLHTGVNPAMDKTNVLLSHVMGASLQCKAVKRHVRLSTQEYTTGLYIKAV